MERDCYDLLSRNFPLGFMHVRTLFDLESRELSVQIRNMKERLM